MKTGRGYIGIVIIFAIIMSLTAACNGASTPTPITTPTPTAEVSSPTVIPTSTPTATPGTISTPSPSPTVPSSPESTATPTTSYTPTPTPTGEEGWHWKLGSFEDYALSGMPDFDQLQDSWSNTANASKWTHCGPVAVANSLWWFDSKYESLSNSGTTAPPALSDHYSMVESYNPDQWDDHDTKNVDPLVKDLAHYMNTDGQRTGGDWLGTYVNDMQQGIKLYLMNRKIVSDYDVHVQKSPEFSWIANEVEHSQDVVLLLGFWEWRGLEGMEFGEWVRLGGHYVTCAGVNYKLDKIGVSDPYLDNAEVGRAGRVLPAPHGYPHGDAKHNDTEYVSHDI